MDIPVFANEEAAQNSLLAGLEVARCARGKSDEAATPRTQFQ